jgi:leucyl aminopeptidase
MPIRLPLASLLVPVRQLSTRPSVAKLARYACAVVLLPPAPSATDWSGLPYGGLLRDVYSRKERKPGDCVQLKVGPHAETTLIATCVPAVASPFERLRSAGQLARMALEGEPTSVVLISQSAQGQGSPDEPMAAALNAAVAALQAAQFRFASFKSNPKAQVPLERIDIASGTKLGDLDETLATSAGNNLARWLTALPPNALDAAGYRRLLQDLARHLNLEFKFYGEAQLKRLGAGAFLAVSQANAARDAGIVYLGYRRGAHTPRVAPQRGAPLKRVRLPTPWQAIARLGLLRR